VRFSLHLLIAVSIIHEEPAAVVVSDNARDPYNSSEPNRDARDADRSSRAYAKRARLRRRRNDGSIRDVYLKRVLAFLDELDELLPLAVLWLPKLQGCPFLSRETRSYARCFP